MDEFFALAHAMEMEPRGLRGLGSRGLDAAARYTETARQLRQQGVEELADLFDHLAESERGHVQQVETWAEQREATLLRGPMSPMTERPTAVNCTLGQVTEAFFDVGGQYRRNV